MKKERIVVMMSGGVDSSVAALLLKERGYDVVGVYILGWTGTKEFPCHWQKEEEDARAVARQLNIPFEVVNLSDDYYQKVILPFLKGYQAGFTPNPDVLCNSEIKFRSLFRAVRQLEADKIATGHYARLRRETPNPKSQIPNIYKGKDRNKDQSYFLWAIDRRVLDKLLLPIGELTKSQVRRIALKRGLKTAAKRDSQGICFIGPLKVRKFIAQNIKVEEGEAVLSNGEVISKHQGVQLYTIGQRLSSGSVKWTGDAPPLFVIAKDIPNNRLIVGKDSECFSDQLYLSSINWLTEIKLPFVSLAKVRYRQEDTEVFVSQANRGIKVSFASPVRAITPGQAVVFYNKKGKLLGGGWIESVPSQEKAINDTRKRLPNKT